MPAKFNNEPGHWYTPKFDLESLWHVALVKRSLMLDRETLRQEWIIHRAFMLHQRTRLPYQWCLWWYRMRERR